MCQLIKCSCPLSIYIFDFILCVPCRVAWHYVKSLFKNYTYLSIILGLYVPSDYSVPSTDVTTGCPVCLVLKQGAVNQLYLEVLLMFLACLDHSRWAKFHLGIR